MNKWKLTQEAFWGSKIRIEITEFSFEIKQTLLGFKWKKIGIKYDRVISETDSHIYLYNSSQRVTIISGEDFGSDFLNVTEDYGNCIGLTSNVSAKKVFEEIEKRINYR